MRTVLAALMVLAVTGVASAQPRPGAFTTLTTTDTTSDSLHVGCAVGSSTCTGGIKAGPSTFASVTTTSSDGVIITSGVPGVTTNKLYNNSGNLYFNGSALATGASVSGTTGKLSKFTGASTLGDSVITETGGAIGVGGNTAVTGTLAVSSTADFASSIQAGSGNVTIVGTDGRIPAISSTYFANLSGANITGIAATTLAAGTHASAYTFSNAANVYAGVGTALTALNGSQIASGTVPAAYGGAPSGMVGFFNLGACPTGWADITDTIGGRYVVALRSGGTLGGQVGTALTDAENRAVGQHTHTATSIVTDGGHTHGINTVNSASLATGADWVAPGVGANSTSSATTGISVGTTNANAGSVTGTNAPYAQFLACIKS